MASTIVVEISCIWRNGMAWQVGGYLLRCRRANEMEGREKNPLACINEAFGGDTDLLNGICPNGIPHLLSNRAEELLVYLRYVEAFASRQVVVPLSSDLGLINDEDLLAVRAGAHRIELEVEIEMGEGLGVFRWPATKVHVS